MKCAIIDNYDSFTYNIFQYVSEVSSNCSVFENDSELITLKEYQPTHLIISPGSGNVENKKSFGISSEAINYFHNSIPLLGICLGHQGIGKHFGMKIERCLEVAHGETSKIRRIGKSKILKNLPSEFDAMRYHSLIVKMTTESEKYLKVTAISDEQYIMTLEHVDAPTFGVQFHPESIGTFKGKSIIKNFLKI